MNSKPLSLPKLPDEFALLVMNMDSMPAKALQINSRRLIYVAHVDYFLQPNIFLLLEVSSLLLYANVM